MIAETIAADATPLVVDVDGTLIRSDLLHEAALQFVARHPLQCWRLLLWLFLGKAGLKARLAAAVDLPAETIPLRAETVAEIDAARANGQPVWLASASDHRWVEGIAGRVGGVAGVLASDGQTNLAGSHKAEALVARFGAGGFDYIGDRPVDMAVWSAARRQLVVAHSGGFERTVRRQFADAEIIARPRAPFRAYAKALRPHQWAKNVLVFLSTFAGHAFAPTAVLHALAAFACFCLAASSAYLVNDLLDLPGDRAHPRKQRRPFAAGTIPLLHGPPLALTLMAAAVALALVLPPAFLAVLIGYVVLTLGYSLVLKRKVLVDVITLGGLYTIRVLGGVAAAGVQESPWLLMFSLFLFLSLAIVKRCSELVVLRDAGADAAVGRGYRVEDLAVLFGLGAAAGYGAVLVISLYIASPEVQLLYRHPERLWLVCPMLLYWISRMLLRANRNILHDDPVVFALTDRVSWVVGLCTAAVVAVAI